MAEFKTLTNEYNKLSDKLFQLEKKIAEKNHKLYKFYDNPTIYEFFMDHAHRITENDYIRLNKIVNEQGIIIIAHATADDKQILYNSSSSKLVDAEYCANLRKFANKKIKESYAPVADITFMSDNKYVDYNFILRSIMKLKFCGAMMISLLTTHYNNAGIKIVFVDIDNEMGFSD